MKCKQDRKKEKERSAVLRSFLKDLEKLNPKWQIHLIEGRIFVNTYEVQKLKLPEDSKIVYEFEKRFTINVKNYYIDVVGW